MHPKEAWREELPRSRVQRRDDILQGQSHSSFDCRRTGTRHRVAVSMDRKQNKQKKQHFSLDPSPHCFMTESRPEKILSILSETTAPSGGTPSRLVRHSNGKEHGYQHGRFYGRQRRSRFPVLRVRSLLSARQSSGCS